ncbi:MAG: hypothetical protein KF778_07990 [Rhodocyclaceae bacterium]|nr:hypothetical protein [Rhodocyclaceae bacterium]MBX3668331.1 hypothetical protein [Rhodocyclaceae bacterium]
MQPPKTGQKTYWHLMDRRKIPSDYEIVGSRLHYYPQCGFAVDTPVSEWYRRHQPPVGPGDEPMRDPQATTYASYVRRKREQEIHLERLCHAPDQTLPADAARDLWNRCVAPARYPLHGLQMAAAYCGSLAPWGRLTVTLGLQAADEMQRVHRLSYRLRQMQSAWPQLGTDALANWEQAPYWQGMREAVERLLVSYDLPECFFALNFVVKPIWESVLLGQAADLARRAGDGVLAALLACFAEDSDWHAACADEALSALLQQKLVAPGDLAAILPRWRALALRAASELSNALDAADGAPPVGQARVDGALARCNARWQAHGLTRGAEEVRNA